MLKSAVAAVLLVGAVGLVWPGEGRVARTSSPAPFVRLYDQNPAHLWNRLHAALFVRVADGREYGIDRVDPLLWIGSTYLLQGPSHAQAVKLLEEFVATHGEKRIADPLKRAMLQRDLWTAFDWLQGDHVNFARPDLSPVAVRRGVDELSSPLATSIARLALSQEQIQSLPDNYAAAASTGVLPADLFASAGPWVSVGRPDGPVAAHHVRDPGPGKNSVFLVFIRLPGGREATLKYLERLRGFDGPFWVENAYPNPGVPQFPAGTQVALVRRALLVDSQGRIAPTRITEQVQLRVYRQIRTMTAHEFDDAHRIDQDMFDRAGQAFEEFSLSRAALFAGRSGGLLSMAALDRFFLTFSSQGFDEFEMAPGDRAGQRREIGTDPSLARNICKDCHAAPGVYSFNSYLPFRLLNPGPLRPARLSEIALADASRVAVEWKQQRPDWRTLQGLTRR